MWRLSSVDGIPRGKDSVASFFPVNARTMCCSSPRLRGCTSRALSLLGSPAISNEPAVSESDPTEGEGEGAGRAGLCAAEPQEEQRSQPRCGAVTVEGGEGAGDIGTPSVS